MPTSQILISISRTQLIISISYLKAIVNKERNVIMWCFLLSVFLSNVAGPVLSPLLRQVAEKDQIAAKTLFEQPHFRQITIISLKVRWRSCHGHTGYLAPLSRKTMCLLHLKAPPFLLSNIHQKTSVRPYQYGTLLTVDATYLFKPDS